MAYPNAGNWYTSSVAYAAVPQYIASHAYAAGALVRQLTTPAVGSERVFVCIAAGTSGAEPTWTLTKGTITAPGTTSFQECTGEPGVNGDISANGCPIWVVSSTPPLGRIIYDPTSLSLQICSTPGAGGAGAKPAFSATAGVTTADNAATWTSLGLASSFPAWSAPHARLANALAAGWSGAGNGIYVADNHAETSAAAIALNSQGTVTAPAGIFSVDHTQPLPATAATLKPGATITSSVAAVSALLVRQSGGQDYWYGFNFIASAAFAGIILGIGGSQPVVLRMEACSFQITGALATSAMVIGASATGGGAQIDLVNCSFGFSASGQQCNFSGGFITWRNTSNPFTGTIPTIPFKFISSDPSTVLIEGIDLSAVGANTLVSNVTSGAYLTLKNCKLGTGLVVPTPPVATGAVLNVDVVNCDSGATNWRNERHNLTGDLITSTQVVRTGGASDGTTAVSHRIVPSNFVRTYNPFNAIPLTIWNAVVGTNRRVTLYGVIAAPGVPGNADFWFDVVYLGSAGSPLGSFASGGSTNPLTPPGSFAVADSSAWDSAAPARLNSTLYNPGQVIKTASNPGRIFICTITGTTGASEPSGFAAAVDGSIIADGAAFRAGYRFSATLILSAPQPAQAGYLTVYPKVGTSAFAYLFLDPLIVLG